MKFPAYPEYRSLHFSWPPQIPSHWAAKWLKYAAPAVNEKTEAPSPRLRYIGLENVESWSGRLLEGEDYSPESTSNLFEAEDVLFGKLRPYLAKVYQAPEKGVCSSEFFVLRPSSVKSDFLKYYLLTQEFVGLVNSSTFGAKMPRAYWEFMGHLPQVIPSEEEQQKIAQFLDYQTAKIDRLIEQQQRLIGLLDKKLQAEITYVIQYGMAHTVFQKSPHAQFRINAPADWMWTRLKHISPRIGVGVVINPSSYVRDEGKPFLFGSEVLPFGFDLSKTRKIHPEDSRKLWRSYLQKGDLVCVRVGYPGSTAAVTEKLEGGNCASIIVVKRGHFESRWLSYAMNSHLGQCQVQMVVYGAAQKQFNLADALNFQFPVPPLQEQQQIADYLDNKLEKIERTKGLLRNNIDLLAEHRSSLISAAVTGKIDVRDWAPTETEPEEFEPAEALHG